MDFRGSRKPKLFSFDIFETLFSVAIAPSQAIWIELGRRLEHSTGLPPEVFVEKRARAFAELEVGLCPITLELVYDQLGHQLKLERRRAQELATVELQLIADLLGPIEQGRRALERARYRSGQPINFVSDMHLPGAFLREQLQRFGLWMDGDVLWVSGEAGARKRDGGLFKLVAGYGRHAATNHLHHIGDDPVADVVAARWAGWSATRARWGAPNVYERLLAESVEARSGSVTSSVAGVARQRRLASTSERDAGAALRGVACGVAAPFMVMYGLWLLGRARAMGLTRLYFLSRDGEVLQRVVSRLAESLDLQLETCYLFGGRAVWQRAAMGLPGNAGYVAALAKQELLRYGDVPIATVASRFGLSDDSIALSANLPQGIPSNRLLNRAERQQVLAFLTSASGREQVQSEAQIPLEDSVDYLSQEGLFRDDKWALVDVGWRGNTVNALNAILGYAGRNPARVLFVGYLGSRRDALPRCDAYLWDSRDPAAPQVPRGAISIVEAFCSGTQGPTIGYERQAGGVVRPVLRRERSAVADRWPLDEFRSAIDSYLERISELAHLGWLDVETRRNAAELLEEFSLRASADEARVLGACPREEDVQADVVHPLAREFKLRDLSTLLRPQATSVARNLGWPRASFVLTPWTRRAIFGFAVTLLRRASRIGAWVSTSLERLSVKPLRRSSPT